MAIKTEAKIEKEVELVTTETPKKKARKKAEPKAEKVAEVSIERVLELKKQLFNHKLDLAQGNSKDTSVIRKTRKQIANILMQLNSKAK